MRHLHRHVFSRKIIQGAGDSLLRLVLRQCRGLLETLQGEQVQCCTLVKHASLASSSNASEAGKADQGPSSPES